MGTGPVVVGRGVCRCGPGAAGGCVQADAHVWRESDLPTLAAGTTVIADGAYLGTGLIVPHRKRADRSLLRGQEEDNAEHRRPCPRRAHLRSDEALQDPPRLPP